MADARNEDVTPIRALIADDDPDIVTILRDRLELMGAIVLTAFNGEEVIRHLETAPVDVVFLDIEMPRMDGIETLRIIRARVGSLPVFMITAAGNTNRLSEADQAGATGIFLKPIQFERMQQALRNLFPSRLRNLER
jgi:DNA-binding NtrC family response regulator